MVTSYQRAGERVRYADSSCRGASSSCSSRAASVTSVGVKPFSTVSLVTTHFFTSRRFGHPGYAQLSQTAPQGLLTGAENRSEIGAFNSLLNPVRLDGLCAKVAEYMPFGLIPVFLFAT